MTRLLLIVICMLYTAFVYADDNENQMFDHSHPEQASENMDINQNNNQEFDSELFYYEQSPWAGLALAFLPGFGLGHFYGGFNIWGGIMLAGNLILPLALSIHLIYREIKPFPSSCDFCVLEIMLTAIIAGAFTAAFKLVEIVSAPVLIHLRNNKAYVYRKQFSKMNTFNSKPLSWLQNLDLKIGPALFQNRIEFLISPAYSIRF